MRLSRNMASMKIYETYKNNIDRQSKIYGNISSGYKVSTYKDNPNAKAQSDRLRVEIRGLYMANRNVQDSVSVLQTADSGIQNITDSLQRARELAVQAGGVHDELDRDILQNEINVILEHVSYTANTTEINGIGLISGENKPGDTISLLVGANPEDLIKLPTFNFTSEGLGLSGVNPIDVKDEANIGDAISRIDAAMAQINSGRDKYGALANRMDNRANNSIEIVNKVEGAEASITSADIAMEMLDFSKNSILIESGISLMAQTNKMPQDILQILQNLKVQ